MRDGSVITRILDLARWAPSGDNTQPWRFEVLEDGRFKVRAYDTRDWCVYDLQGRASQIAVGALWENIVIAASVEGLEARVIRLPDSPETRPVLDVRLIPSTHLEPDSLHAFLETRTTQRRPLETRGLSDQDRIRLEAAIGPDFRVIWIAGSQNKRLMARLLYLNSHIRLTMEEAYRVHKGIIEWDASFSEDRIPDRAIGLDPFALRIMKWAMQSWDRVQFMNRYLGGTLMPRLQMDVIPALRCAAHFLLVAKHPLEGIDQFLNAGRAVQRFWLTATSLGVQFQPEMTPLIFAQYAQQGIHFSEDPRATANAGIVERKLGELAGPNHVAAGAFLGRVGYGSAPEARSVRLPLERLLA